MELKANSTALSSTIRYKRAIIALVLLAIAITAVLVGSRISEQRAKQEQQKAYKSGHEAYSKGRFDQAIKDLEKAKKLNPDDPKTHANLAQSYEAKGQLDKAAEEYAASLKANPNQPEAHYNLAIIYKSQGKLDKAIDNLAEAVKLDTNFVAARIELGGLYAQTGDNVKAKEQYQKVIDLKPFGVDLEAIKNKLNNLD